MPEFGNPFAGNTCDRKLTKEELIRAIRFNISAEYEAVQMYVQLAESTEDDLSKKVFYEIANEEIIHAGEFLRLLKELAPKEQFLYDHGAKEVEELIKRQS